MKDDLITTLRARLGAADVLDGLTERLARAHDASIYRMVPRVVVRPRGIDDVRALFTACRAHRTHVTFRAAGTSLSGQAVTDGVLAELGAHWRRATVGDGGATVTSEPGVPGGRLNALLARYGRRIGPDPASIAAAMIGGIVANNASGMCCGTHANSYQTLVGLKLVLADGFVLDTAAPDADARLARERPEIYSGLEDLRRRVAGAPELAALVRRKYALKNTMGYGLNALVDFSRPADILAHLLVGSEGTLGFIAEVTLRTVTEEPHKATALAYFAHLADAGAAVAPLADGGATVLEVLDASSLQALADEVAFPFALTGDCAALLVEVQESDRGRLAVKTEACLAALDPTVLLAPVAFTEDAALRAKYWKLRKGLFPKVGAQRRPGTAVVIEDVCLPRERLAEGIRALRALFERHGFGDAVIFGHAKDGNLHFVLCNDFARDDEVARYVALMDELAELVAKRFGGSLKAEHGTGRNMAPFVRLEWGDALYEVMRDVKKLLDPDGILSPGVLLTDDPRAHVKHLKALPAVAARVDQCIECGFCETVCPSRALSLTPRQRIALRREAAQASRKVARQLTKEFAYAGVSTCAGDGLCASVCPVGIDTGVYMKELAAAKRSRVANAVAMLAAKRVGLVAGGARLGLRAAQWLEGPARFVGLLPREIPLPRAAAVILSEAKDLRTKRSFASLRMTPMPAAGAVAAARALAAPSAQGRTGKPSVVYFAACLSKIMAPSSPASPSTADAVARALDLAGFAVVPASRGTLCCGQAFVSKAYPAAARAAAEALVDALWESSAHGAIPVVCDTSPCTARLWSLADELTGDHLARWQKLSLHDFPSFVARYVLPTRKTWPKLERRLVLHPTCSSVKHGTTPDLVAVAKAFATDVVVPVSAGCCGFAGDKGFRLPELTLSATRDEAAEVRALAPAFAYSTCQTCAFGMEAATGLTYHPIASLCVDALQKCNDADSSLTPPH